MSIPLTPWRPGALILLLALARAAVAQEALFVKQGDKFYPVIGMAANTPLIAANGKLEAAINVGGGFAFALGPAKTFAPLFVTVRNLSIVAQDHITDPNGRPEDRELSFHAEFDSSAALDNVFLALEVKGSTVSVHRLYAYEVGRLRPGVATPVQFLVRFEADWTQCHATLHVFVGGPEVLNSTMPPAQVAQDLDRMVQEKLAGVANAPPRPFMCPPPLYPAAALGTDAAGRATIAFEISPTGAVVDPVLKQASQPEFGNAALAAVREWRFLPRVKDGKPVASRVELPLDFRPPAPSPAPAKP